MEGLLAARGRTWSTLPLSLRSASASRVSTIWRHGLFVRHSWEAHCKLSLPFESHVKQPTEGVGEILRFVFVEETRSPVHGCLPPPSKGGSRGPLPGVQRRPL